MDPLDVSFPKAIASYDDEGVAAAIRWSLGHRAAGEDLTLWTYTKQQLDHCSQLKALASKSNVDHIVGRGGGHARSSGPILMAWPDMGDIGQLFRTYVRKTTALCIIAGNEDKIRPWVWFAQPEILGDGSAWNEPAPALDPVVVRALVYLTGAINHNNTLGGGYEKDIALSALYALSAAGLPMDGASMQGWALAHGWTGENPAKLATHVADINNGKRLRYQQMFAPNFVASLQTESDEDSPSVADEV